MEENEEKENGEELTRLYYKIGDVADLIGVTQSKLRFWDEQFADMPGFLSRKNEKGTRKYSAQNIENLRLLLYLLKEKRMTIEGAKKHIKNNKSGKDKEETIILHLKRIREYLMGEMAVYEEFIKKNK